PMLGTIFALAKKMAKEIKRSQKEWLVKREKSHINHFEDFVDEWKVRVSNRLCQLEVCQNKDKRQTDEEYEYWRKTELQSMQTYGKLLKIAQDQVGYSKNALKELELMK
ncbi:unnamed protein product, partial [marine sediment metagenome]